MGGAISERLVHSESLNPLCTILEGGGESLSEVRKIVLKLFGMSSEKL